MQTIEFSPDLFNKSVSKWYKTKKRFCVVYGGSGSGKSHGIAQLLLLKVLSNEDMNVICFRKHSTDARNSIFALFKQIINEFDIADLFKINQTERKITHIESGNVILITGLDNSEKIKSITSETGIFSIAWIEEATEITYANLKQVSLRLRGQSKHKKTIYLSFNPISEEHWIKKDFIDLRNDEIDIYHSTFKDNKFIDDEYRKELEAYKELDTNYYNIYARGEWGAALQGLVYPAIWKIEDTKFPIVETIYGLDFGFSTSKTALVRVDIHDYHIVSVKLLWYKTGTHIDSDFAGWLKTFVGKSPIYCDSADSDKIDFLYNMGLNARKSDKNVVSGCELIQNIQTIYIAKDSIEIIKEKSLYKWATDKNGNSLGHPQKNLDDHALDALRYAIFTHFTTNVRYIKQAKALTKQAEANIYTEQAKPKILDLQGMLLITQTALKLKQEHGRVPKELLLLETGYNLEQCLSVLKNIM